MKNMSISITEEQLEWVESQTGGKLPTSKSRVIQKLIVEKMESEEAK